MPDKTVNYGERAEEKEEGTNQVWSQIQTNRIDRIDQPAIIQN